MNVKNIEIPMQNTTFETPNLPNEIKKNRKIELDVNLDDD